MERFFRELIMKVGKRTDNKTFWWGVHNIIAHPLSFIFHISGDILHKVSSLIHDETIPIHETKQDSK